MVSTWERVTAASAEGSEYERERELGAMVRPTKPDFTDFFFSLPRNKDFLL
jgi:hypothetical protein